MKIKHLLLFAFASTAPSLYAQTDSSSVEDAMVVDTSVFADLSEDTANDALSVDSSLAAYGDLFSSITSYKFSEMRYNARGYDSQYSDVFLNGVRMNDAITGYTPWSLWSGLNEATRNKETTVGLDASSYGVGGLNSSTNILARASYVRKGWSTSLVSTNSMYRARAMATYASGMQDNGWAYAFSVSTRQGDNAFYDGVYYNTFGYFASVERKINDQHLISATILGAPSERGVQSAATQETYDLVGSNYYNPNVGIQDGELRNVRVKDYHEPIAMLNYEFKIDESSKITAASSFRFGQNGYSALTWYAGQDPRPDYYRYLPSYYACPNPAQVAEQWMNNTDNIRYIDLDNLYNINYNGEQMSEYGDGNRSTYMIEERHADQRDFNFSAQYSHTTKNNSQIFAGVDFRRNRTEYYTEVKDLLGGDYWVDVDKFAERDFGSNDYAYQNNLDYYEKYGYAQAVREGDKFSYDYYANVIKGDIWGKYNVVIDGLPELSTVVSAEVGFSSMWRNGLWRKGLFADNSQGDSEKLNYLTYKAKLNLDYRFSRAISASANVAYMNEAPTFQNSFISPRTRNSTTPGLDTEKILSMDAGVKFDTKYAKISLSGYITTIKDQTDVISFYNDLQSSYDNLAISGIDKRYVGIEAAISVPVPFVSGLSVNAAASLGEYLYDSNPEYIEMADNSAEALSQGTIYWDGFRVDSTPQTAINVGLSYRSPSYIFASVDLNYYDQLYISMNPLCRTDEVITSSMSTADVVALREQEKFDASYVMNASIGKSWLKGRYSFGASLEIKNLLNFTDIRTGGYEQLRLSETEDDGGNVVGYERFDSKYYYMMGRTYYLNVYLRF